MRAADVQASGLGTYTATIERSLLADGSNELEITVSTDANDVSIPVKVHLCQQMMEAAALENSM